MGSVTSKTNDELESFLNKRLGGSVCLQCGKYRRHIERKDQRENGEKKRLLCLFKAFV